jgi:hypothetical protein
MNRELSPEMKAVTLPSVACPNLARRFVFHPTPFSLLCAPKMAEHLPPLVFSLVKPDVQELVEWLKCHGIVRP